MGHERLGFRVLGPIEVVVGDLDRPAQSRTLRGPRQSQVLALMIATRGRTLSSGFIRDQVWGGSLVDPTAVRVNVSRLRSRIAGLGAGDPIDSTEAGYRLEASPEVIDAEVFSGLADDVQDHWRRNDLDRVEEAARRALALWRSTPFEGVDDIPAVEAMRDRLVERRHEAGETLALALLRSGRHHEALTHAVAVRDDDPWRERPWAIVMASLHSLGRTTDALRAHDELTTMLLEEMGLVPGPEVRGVADAIGSRSEVTEMIAAIAMVGGDRGVGPPTRVVGRQAMYGRDAERQVLVELLAADEGALVVEASAGLGKTRLVEEATRLASGKGLTVGVGVCPRGEAVGQVALRQIVAGALGTTPIGPDDLTILQGLTRSFPELVSQLGRAEHPAEALDPLVAQTRVYGLVEHLLHLSDSPVLIIDDAQWIDRSTAALVMHLSAVVPRSRWLVATRDGDRTRWADGMLAQFSRSGARWLTLGPLGAENSARMVHDALPDLAADEVDRIVTAGRGSPLTLTELIQHVGHGGDPSALPRGLAAVIAAEVAAIDSSAVALAHAAAVADSPHPLGVVAAAVGLDNESAARAMASAVSAGLVATDASRSQIWPGHDLVGRALRDQLTEPQAQAMHRQLADALAGWRTADPSLRLRHLFAAGGSEAAELDAAAALALADPILEAAPHEMLALAVPLIEQAGLVGTSRDGVRARIRAAAAYFSTGDPITGGRVLRAQQPALDQFQDPRLDAAAIIARSAAATHGAMMAADYERALEILDRLTVERDDSGLAVSLLCWAAQVAMQLGRMPEAWRLAARGRELAGSIGSPPRRMEVTIVETALSMDFGAPPGLTDELVQEMEEFARSAGDAVTTAAARLIRVEQAMRTGTVGDVEQAVETSTLLDNPTQRSEVRWWILAARAGLDIMRGDLVEGERSANAALSFGAEHGIGMALAMTLIHRFSLAYDADSLGDLLPLLPPVDRDTTEPMLCAGALVWGSTGDRDRAREAADALAEPDVLSRSGPGRWPSVAALGGAAAWILRHEELGMAVASSLDRRADTGLSVTGLAYLGPVSLARGLGWAAAGELDRAVDDLAAAVAREIETGAPAWLARAAKAASEVLAVRGRAADRREIDRYEQIAHAARARIGRAS